MINYKGNIDNAVKYLKSLYTNFNNELEQNIIQDFDTNIFLKKGFDQVALTSWTTEALTIQFKGLETVKSLTESQQKLLHFGLRNYQGRAKGNGVTNSPHDQSF